MSMTSSRPYLLRALYEWILENNCTPYIVVNAYAEGVQVPQDYVKDGQIILNISPVAVHGLLMGNDALEFNGRFAGIPTPVYVPSGAIMGIYARENGQGMVFDAEKPSPLPPTPPKPPAGLSPVKTGSGDGNKKPRGRAALRIVK
ncbi:MAG: ClpXP protease specificity-enhancing factor [Pseudohongiella sp.]|nr:ClpXP protease specificity-enhancing factor [Pseudohongiella sp.]MDO9520863.1 ClpXP protease specificity-enhancing factor [Pseudohongiella sp.]MDP2128074.1 ClpXP protease specificity-enhancing factor [Pseudohongiella sp.]